MNCSTPCFLNKKKEALRILSVFLCLCLCLTMVMAGNIQVAFCEDTEEGDKDTSSIADTIEGIVNLGATEIYGIMRAIIIPIVICFIAYAGLLFLGGGTQGTDKARKVCIGCFAAIMFVAFAPIIGNQVGGWVADSYDGDLGAYNPLD